jgi:hypothetical protein
MKSEYKLFAFQIIFATFFSASFVFSQTPGNDSFNPIVNSIPTSPEAALLGRFGDIQVGYYTGTASISVPLYSLSQSGIEIPITLNYHSSGIKVSDEATWVGLGWSLAPEGMIIQEVRGMPDHLDNNLNQISSEIAYNTFKNRLGPSSSGVHYSVFQQGPVNKYLCNGMVQGPLAGDDGISVITSLLQGHGQPDIYNYNFYGYSGEFYINPETDEVVLIDKKQDIVFEKLGFQSGWSATTPDGNVFVFTTVEQAQGYAITDLRGYTFKVSRIRFNNGKEAVFSYTDELYTSIIRRETALVKTVEPDANTLLQVYPDISYNQKKTLTQINFDDIIINFNLEQREDINLESSNNVKRLQSIDIKSEITNKKIKSFVFDYSYFPYNFIGAPKISQGTVDPYIMANQNALGKRLKLNSIQEIGYDENEVENNSKNPYLFEYETSVTMPLKCSFAVDFYGYYNGKDNNNYLPNLDFFEYQKDPVYKNTNFDSGLYFNYDGADRYSDYSKAGAYMIKKITYPTKGYSEFGYEPNTFTNQFIPDKLKVEAMSRNIVVMDNNLSENVTSNYFTLNKNTTVKFINSIVPHNVNLPPYTYQQMLPSYILLYKVKMVNGSPQVTNIKQWNLSTVLAVDFDSQGGKVWQEEILIEYDPNPTTKFFIKVYMPDSLNNPNDYYHSANVKSIVNFFSDEGIDTSQSIGGGLRIKTIKNYHKQGEISSYKNINYQEGKLLNKFEPLEVIYALSNDCIHPSTYSTFFKKVMISSDDFGLNCNNLIGYGKVVVEELNDDNENNGKIINYYENEINQTRKGFPNSPYLKNGLIKKEQVYSKSNILLREKRYNYINLIPFKSYSGIKITNHTFGQSDFVGNLIFEYINPFVYKYSYGLYPINSEWNMLSGVATDQYINGEIIQNTEQYIYNDYGNISSSVSLNSSNVQITTSYKYATDLPLDNVIAQMLVRNMKGIPLVTENYHGNYLALKKELKYGFFDNDFPLPKEVYIGKGVEEFSRRVNYNLYDNKGNILQFMAENGITICYIWGYNKTKPVAKIENIAYGNIPSNLITDIQLATTDVELQTTLEALRNSPTLNNSMVTTYIYKPLVGVSKITDSKGYTTKFHYDDFNRLEKVTDMEGNILSENEYHYRTQN